jgi:hypothetical protein
MNYTKQNLTNDQMINNISNVEEDNINLGSNIDENIIKKSKHNSASLNKAQTKYYLKNREKLIQYRREHYNKNYKNDVEYQKNKNEYMKSRYYHIKENEPDLKIKQREYNRLYYHRKKEQQQIEDNKLLLIETGNSCLLLQQ